MWTRHYKSSFMKPLWIFYKMFQEIEERSDSNRFDMLDSSREKLICSHPLCYIEHRQAIQTTVQNLWSNRLWKLRHFHFHAAPILKEYDVYHFLPQLTIRGRSHMWILCKWLKQHIRVFQNKGIFVQLDQLDQLDNIVPAWIRIHLQFQTRTKDTLACLTVVQATWVQSLLKLTF